MINGGITGASKLVSDSLDLLSLGLGISLSEKEIEHRNNSLLRNWHRTNYNIDSISLTSKTHRIEPTGIVAGTTKVGALADVYSSEGRKGLSVEEEGGLFQYTTNQQDADIDERNVRGAMFRDGIVNNSKFKQGASFINPSNFDSYDINNRDYKSIYTTSSINATEPSKMVKGAYKYNGGNEDLIERVVVNNTDVNNDYIMYNEKARGNMTNSSNLLVTDDTTDFMVDDSYSSSSLLLGEYEDTVKPRTLAMRTNELFRYGKIGSIVARFKTDNDFGATDWPTAKTAAHGMSRGRNLLKKNPNDPENNINGYNNPYCRVWTNHYQYAKHNNLIRPFVNGKTGDGINGSDLRANLGGLNAHVNGCGKNEQLAKYSVLETNGHVKVTPYRDDDDRYTGEDKNLKQYMFSIENLAWKGFTDKLSDEQKGPNGGRIMWFPPYDLKFSESSHAQWSSHTFIGRGEKIYTYGDSERSGSIEFSILADHPSIVDVFTNQNKDATEKNEQTILRFFAGCDDDIVKKIEGEEEDECKEIEVTRRFEADYENNDRTVEIPESLYVAFPVFYQNNFTGVNYLNPDKYKYEFSYDYSNDSDNGYRNEDPVTSERLKFNEIRHKSGTYMNIKKVTEPYFEGKTVTDGEKILMENEWYTLDYAGSSSDIGTINTVSLKNATSKTNRYNKEANNGSSLSTLDFSKELMNSELEKESGSNNFVKGKRHVYAQDAARYSRELQGKSEIEVFGKNLRVNYYDCVTYGLNTKIFSDCYNSSFSKTPDSTSFIHAPQKDTTQYNRTKKAFEIAGGIIKGVTNQNPEAKVVSLEEMQEVHSLGDLFKVLGEDYITSAKTSQGDIVEISWEIETLNAYASASFSGKNNKSLAYLRYLFVYEILRTHGIEISDFNQDLLSTVDTTGTDLGAIPDNVPEPDTVITTCTNGKPSEKATRFGCIYFRIYPVIHCDKDRVVRIGNSDDIKSGDIIMSDDEQHKYLICSRNKTLRKEASISKSLVNGDCETVCKFPNGVDKEYQYFKKIKTTDPVLFKNIIKKFQYFDPAFHSISPEGFNARLTFLQQCTRQGPTTSVSENGIVSTIGAGNLAFGTPPYCIIRIGDFFNTKVVIESVQITYDSAGGIAWDLNPEGIGVQPMYAHVQLSVKFLGGSDIAAPVSRLQNAVSANYYANASVYDNTALKDATEQHDYDIARNKIHSRMHKFKDN